LHAGAIVGEVDPRHPTIPPPQRLYQALVSGAGVFAIHLSLWATSIRSAQSSRFARLTASSEEEVLGTLVEAWRAKFGDMPKTCREAIFAASGDRMELFDAMRAATREAESISPAKLGSYIGRVSNRISRGLRFEFHGLLHGNRAWRVTLCS
jgi:hypothetical protein